MRMAIKATVASLGFLLATGYAANEGRSANKDRTSNQDQSRQSGNQAGYSDNGTGYSEDQAGVGGSARAGNSSQGAIQVQGMNMSQAPVPEYWLADAAIFVQNAATTADVMNNEGNLNVTATGIIGNQAQYLNSTIQRAISDLQALSSNAASTNPSAVGPIQSALGQLNAAGRVAGQVAQSAQSGNLGPNYQEALSVARKNLRDASQQLGEVGSAYNAEQFTGSLTGGKGKG